MDIQLAHLCMLFDTGNLIMHDVIIKYPLVRREILLISGTVVQSLLFEFKMTARIVAAFSYIMFVCSVNGIQFYSKTSNALDLGHTDDNDSGILQLPAYLVFYNKSYSSLVVSTKSGRIVIGGSRIAIAGM